MEFTAVYVSYVSYLSSCVKVEERFVPNAERFLGLVDQSHLDFFRAWEDDFLFYTQEASAEVTLTHRLALDNQQ